MSIYEYNEEYVRKSLFEDGKEEGSVTAENKFGKLVNILLDEEKYGDLRQVCKNKKVREAFYKQYGISD